MIEKMVPVIEAALSLVGEKKEDFLSLVPLCPDAVNPARQVIKSQMGSLHDRALTLANSMIRLSPVCSPSSVDHTRLELISAM